MADQIQKVTTDFSPIGVEDLQKAYNLIDKIDKSNVDPNLQGANKQFSDLKKTVGDLSDNQLEKLKTNFNQLAKNLTPFANAIKNLPVDKVKQLDKLLEGVTDEFKVAGINAKFLKDNMDKLNLKPKEFKELQQSLTTVDKIVKEFGNDIEVVGQKNQSLRGKLAAVRNELTLLDQAGKSNTQTYKNLQIQAGRLQDEIEDNRNAVKALASDTLTLDAGVGAVRGLVAGFTAYQGILGLTGESSKEFEKTLIKINGAMAVLQGLQEITNLLQKESAVRLVATSIATDIWNKTMELSNRLLGIKKVETIAATVATEAQTLATEELVVAETAATASTRAMIASAAIIAAVFVAVGTAVYFATKAIIDYIGKSKALSPEEVEKRNEALLKQIARDRELAKIRLGGINDLERELELLKAKGSSLEVLTAKQNELSKAQISDITESLKKIQVPGLLTPKTLLEIKKFRDEIRAIEAEMRVRNIELLQTQLANEHKINELRIGNIKTEYERKIASLNESAKEEIRLAKINSDLTGKQKIETENAINERLRQDKLKLDFEANKQLAVAANEITKDQYDKQLIIIEQTYENDLLAYKGKKEDQYIYDAIIERKKQDAIIKLDEDAQLKIQALKDSLIKDEYTKKIKSLEAQSRADILAFVGNPEAKAAYELGVNKKLAEDKAELDRIAQNKIADLKNALIADEFTKQVQQAQDAYLADYEAFAGNEKDKETYRLLLEDQRNKKLKKLTDDAEKKIIDVHIGNIQNANLREIAAAKQRYDEDLKNFVGSEEQKARYKKELDERLRQAIKSDSIFGKLFGLDKEQEKQIKAAFDTALNLITQIADAKVAQDDREIASQEAKIERFKELAETGSAELLQLEEDRLEKLKRKREEDVESQKILAGIQLSINSALAVSEGILATIAAFNPLNGGNLVTGVLTALALAATVASSIVSINNAFSSVPAFAKGTEYLDGHAKSDGGMIIEGHKGERIVPVKENKKLKGIKNSELPELVAIGKLVRESGLNNFAQMGVLANSTPDLSFAQSPGKDYTKHYLAMENKLDKVINRLDNIETTVSITEEGIEKATRKVQERKANIVKRANL